MADDDKALTIAYWYLGLLRKNKIEKKNDCKERNKKDDFEFMKYLAASVTPCCST